MQLGEDRYRIRARGRDAAGRRIERERLIRAPSLKAAEAARADLEREIRTDAAPRRDTRLRLGEHARAWAARKLGAKRSDGTYRLAPATRARIAHDVREIVVPMLGDIAIEDIDRRTIEEWRDHLAEHYRSGSVNLYLRMLREILRDADCRVADSVRTLETDDTRISEAEPNLLEDERELRAFVEATARLYPEFLALVMVLLTSGARISTVLALRWTDIDAVKGSITFRRRLSLGEVVPGLKRGRQATDVAPLLPGVKAELDKLRSGYTEAQRACGLVFSTPAGQHCSRYMLLRPFQRIARAAGIERRLTPHGLRRTAATLYRRAAGSVVSMAVLGHLEEKTHAHYSRVSVDERLEAARRAFAGIDGGIKSTPQGGSTGLVSQVCVIRGG